MFILYCLSGFPGLFTLNFHEGHKHSAFRTLTSWYVSHLTDSTCGKYISLSPFKNYISFSRQDLTVAPWLAWSFL